MCGTCRPRTSSVDPEHDFRMLWEVDDKSQKRLNDIARAMKGANKLILATDPDREGEAISWHVLEVLKESTRSTRSSRSSGWCSMPSTKQAVLDAMKHPATSTGLWSMPISPAARSDYLVGFTSRRCCGASCRARVRPAACNRWRCGWCAIASWNRGSSSREYWSLVATLATARRPVRGAAGRRRRQEKIQRLDVGTGAEAGSLQEGAGEGAVRGGRDRGQAGPAQPAAAVHHLDPAAGGEPQARLCARPHHALARALYEGVDIEGDTVGLITYMRTDGVDIAPEAVTATRRLIGSDYGDRYVPSSRASTETRGQERPGGARGDPAD
jgi:DNA topoisomerase-1